MTPQLEMRQIGGPGLAVPETPRRGPVSIQMHRPEHSQAAVQHMLVTAFHQCIGAMEALEAEERNEDPTNCSGYSESTWSYFQAVRKRKRTRQDV